MKILVLISALLLTACHVNPSKPIEHNQKNAYKASELILNCSTPDGHHIISETAKCPSGGEDYSSLSYVIYSTYGVNTDWEPISYLSFPLPVPVCASNGFIVDKDKMTPDEIAKRKAFIESDSYQQLYKQKHASYFLFAKQTEALNENTESLWWYYLKATWEAKNCDNTQRYAEYANLVISEAQKRKAELTNDKEEYWTLSIIIPEMYRRVGNFEAAQSELNKFTEPKLPEEKANDFYKLAKAIMQKAISEKDRNQLPIKSKDEKQ